MKINVVTCIAPWFYDKSNFLYEGFLYVYHKQAFNNYLPNYIFYATWHQKLIKIESYFSDKNH